MTDADAQPLLEIGFAAEVFYWRGPSPFFFAAVPEPQATRLREVARAVTYGWGMIPARAMIGDTVFATALFPKDGGYLLPIKAAARRGENITAGDRVEILLTVDQPQR